ncbi:MAG TPA: D-Ala-D-Ala carboxypeptidase family metallohydrolase [Coleofasciculaceae cyanobacterium]
MAVVLLTFGSAMILVCIVGKVEVKELKFGTSKRWARLFLGVLGTLMIVLSLVSYINPNSNSNLNSSSPTPTPNSSSIPYRFNRSLEKPIVSGGLFTWSDATKGGKRVPDSQAIEDNIIKIADELEKLKKTYFSDKKILIVEWYRDLAANRAVGGERYSLHLQGSAIKFRVEGIPSTEVYEILDKHWEGGLGAYPKQNYVQIDLRPRVRWIN